MLYELLRYLHEEQGWPRLGTYPSFRAALAFFMAFVACALLAPRTIRWLQRLEAKDSYHKVGAERRAAMDESKQGTPTMGGILTVSVVTLTALCWVSLSSPFLWIGLLVFVGAGAIGLWDDWVKLFDAEKHGIRGWTKLLLLGVVSIAAAWLLANWAYGGNDQLLVLVLPLLKGWDLPLMVAAGLPFYAIAFFGINGMANAVNLTDGMDGLAAGLFVIAGAGMCAVGFVVGDAELASFLFVPHVAGAMELAVLMAAAVGAALGFLWVNAAPAQVFMGDVGSLSFGALLGYSGIAARMELSLVLLSGVFFAELMSVVLQVGSCKLRKKRIFLCSPLHHHFQYQGMPETRIVIRFWIAGLLLAVLGVALFKLR